MVRIAKNMLDLVDVKDDLLIGDRRRCPCQRHSSKPNPNQNPTWIFQLHHRLLVNSSNARSTPKLVESKLN